MRLETEFETIIGECEKNNGYEAARQRAAWVGRDTLDEPTSARDGHDKDKRSAEPWKPI